MLRSSLGFHTFTISLTLLESDIFQLIRDFKEYSRKTGLIRMYPVDKKINCLDYECKNNDTFIPTHLQIRYYKEDRGIKWDIRFNNWCNDFQLYTIDATINPKILSGIHDYITSATYDDIPSAITNFNKEAQRISPLLRAFENYSIKRIDYCINFSLNELAPACTSEQMIDLIKRGNVPHHYKEWAEYDPISHRTKSKPGSFYLINNSVNINCYSKYMQLQDRSSQNELLGFPPVSQITMNAAKDIIRFEVQCKYLKTYSLSNKAVMSGNEDLNKYTSLLTDEACSIMITDYFDKIIGRGDWYTLQDAINIIQSRHFNKQKEKRLIDALYTVNQCRSLAKAKASCPPESLRDFKQTLKDLSRLGINPVTIPIGWGIPHIPNLLNTYNEKAQQEYLQKKWEEQIREEVLLNLHDYLLKT